MANDNHLLSVTCYNVTMTSDKYYNESFELGQQKINFSFYELRLPDDDPVYTLKKVMEDIDFSGLLAQYSNKGRNGFNPIMMYATVVYAAMRGIRSVDTIVDLCRRDLAFIWLTQGNQPKRDAFYEFKNLRLTEEVLNNLALSVRTSSGKGGSRHPERTVYRWNQDRSECEPLYLCLERDR